MDWYRHTTWTEQNRDDFHRRLKRARDKSQYLRIQAVHLAEGGNNEAAIELLTLLVRDHPDDVQLAQAHLQLAESYAKIGDRAVAIANFRSALDVERRFSNVRTQAWLLFPWFIVEHRLSDLYAEAVAILDEFCQDMAFPVERYQYNAIQALLAEYAGDPTLAGRFARAALSASSEQESGLPRHPRLGLVDTSEGVVHPRLVELSQSAE